MLFCLLFFFFNIPVYNSLRVDYCIIYKEEEKKEEKKNDTQKGTFYAQSSAKKKNIKKVETVVSFAS